MRRSIIVATLLVAALPAVRPCHAQLRPPVAGPAAVPVAYEIEAELDPATHRVSGRETVRWTNTASVPASELWFHLYLNAFASSRTTFMRGLDGSSLRGIRRLGEGWGYLELTTLEADGVDLLPHLEFVRPDDGNADDFTVARVALPAPVQPGGSVRLRSSFVAQLPALIARTGYADDFHLVAQWFPKLGVFEDAGQRGRPEAGWSCHQFHATSEFYADFASFRVSLEVPAGWEVAATGIETERRDVTASGAVRQRVAYQADNVHDFAWCAAPSSLMAVVEEEFEPARDVPQGWMLEARSLLGLSAAELELPPTHLRLLLPRTQLPLAGRMLRAARLSLAWLGLRLGPYPYLQLTIVSPPPTAEEAGGMEYPTLITTGASRLLAYPPFAALPWIESVTAHELAHQYFYGLIASDEVEEPWLDEGLASWAEASCLEAMAADGHISRRLGAASWLGHRLALAVERLPVRSDRPAFKYREPGEYARGTYARPALAMRTLEGVMGRAAFARALRAYVERFRFRHPGGNDLIGILEQAAGAELGGLVAQLARSDAEADWAVLAVRNLRPDRLEGFVEAGGKWQAAPPTASEPTGWEVEVDLARRGELLGPVQATITFADGTTERRTWDGRERWVRWRLESSQPAVEVVVDPDGVWALEVRRSDNYWRSPSSWSEQRRGQGWLEAALALLETAVLPWS